MPEKSNTLNITLMCIACGLTILGTTITLILIRWLKVKTKFSSYINMLLCSDLVFAIMTIWSRTAKVNEDSQVYCSVLSFFVEFASIMSFYWTLSFAINTYLVVNLFKKDVEQYFTRHLIIAITISFIISVIPTASKVYGMSKYGGCGVNIKLNMQRSALVTLAIQYFPLLICLVLIFIFYGLVFRKLYQIARAEHVQISHLKGVLIQFLPYPLILAICGIPGMIGLIIEVSSERSIRPLLLASGFLYRIMGLFNAIVYGLHHETKRKLREKCVERPKKALTMIDSSELERTLTKEAYLDY